MSVYCCSDLHGRYDLFAAIKNFIKPEDKVYVLGDCADRGPEGWKIIKEVYENPQFIYVKGNHEDMLIQTMKAYKIHENPYNYEYKLLRSNGGESTYKAWLKEENKLTWIDKLDNLPLWAEYTNKAGIRIFMSHSGSDENSSEEEFLWSRDHFFHWTSKYDVIVHGHTPSELMNEDFKPYGMNQSDWDLGAYWYSSNRKINIDCGSVWTGYTVLLNLDAWDEEIFTAEDFKYEDYE